MSSFYSNGLSQRAAAATNLNKNTNNNNTNNRVFDRASKLNQQQHQQHQSPEYIQLQTITSGLNLNHTSSNNRQHLNTVNNSKPLVNPGLKKLTQAQSESSNSFIRQVGYISNLFFLKNI